MAPDSESKRCSKCEELLLSGWGGYTIELKDSLVSCRLRALSVEQADLVWSIGVASETALQIWLLDSCYIVSIGMFGRVS